MDNGPIFDSIDKWANANHAPTMKLLGIFKAEGRLKKNL